MPKRGDRIPATDHVLRYIAPNRMIMDEKNETVIAIKPQAFELKEGEEHLSLTWVEFFAVEPEHQITCAVQAFRGAMDRPLAKKGGFAKALVGKIHEVCADLENPEKVRILYSPTERNKGHAEIRRYPRDNLELRQALANQALAEFFLARSVPEADSKVDNGEKEKNP